MSTRAEKNKVCQTVLDWQTERELENWNEDTIKYELGIIANENTLLLVDDSNLDEETNTLVEFEDGKFGSYTLNYDEGLYSISKKTTRTRKEQVEGESSEEEE